MIKIVREHINEKFTEDSDPIHDMGIGYRRFIEKWLKEHDINDYIINNDLTIDLDHSLSFYFEPTSNLPKYIQFNHVNGEVNLTSTGVTSLRGFPKTIKGSLYLGRNNLKSLKYCPQGEINSLMIFKNSITSLKGCPSKIYNNFNCTNNPLKSLNYMPTYIGGDFICYPGDSLTLSEDYIYDYIMTHKIFIGGKRITTIVAARNDKYITTV